MSVFLKAIEEIENRGWGKGALYDPVTGCVCALGALSFALGIDVSLDNMESHPLFKAPVKQLASIVEARRLKQYGWMMDCAPVHSVWAYNDSTVHTKEDIISLFREAHDLECAQANLTEPSSAPPVS